MDRGLAAFVTVVTFLVVAFGLVIGLSVIRENRRSDAMECEGRASELADLTEQMRARDACPTYNRSSLTPFVLIVQIGVSGGVAYGVYRSISRTGA